MYYLQTVKLLYTLEVYDLNNLLYVRGVFRYNKDEVDNPMVVAIFSRMGWP